MHNYTWLVDNFYLAQHFHLDSSYKLNIIDHIYYVLIGTTHQLCIISITCSKFVLGIVCTDQCTSHQHHYAQSGNHNCCSDIIHHHTLD